MVAYYIVDAFTDRPFPGNPAAVVPLESWPSDAWLQGVAAEMNLAETAFLVPDPSGYALRWLTPTVEVDLCGHATLATAAVLAHLGSLGPNDRVTFSSRSGPLHASRVDAGYQLDFPIVPSQEVNPPPGLLEALGVRGTYVGRNSLDYLVEVATEAELLGMSPNFSALRPFDCRGVIVTCISHDPAYDFASRFFAPAAGVDEDPVTGSAHCALAHHWQSRHNKSRMTGIQLSKRRGVVQVEIDHDRVLLGGQAILVAHGQLLIPPE